MGHITEEICVRIIGRIITELMKKPLRFYMGNHLRNCNQDEMYRATSWGIPGGVLTIFPWTIPGSKCGQILEWIFMKMPGKITAEINVGIFIDIL